MRVVLVRTYHQAPGRGLPARILIAASWIFVALTVVGMVGVWLESRKPKPTARRGTAVDPSPIPVPAGPDRPSREELEAEEVFREVGLDGSVVRRLLPTLDSPAATATLRKRFVLDAETESRFLSLLKTMEERRELLKQTVLVHKAAVDGAKELQDLILRHVREGGPLGRPELRDLWRAAVEAETRVDVPDAWHADEIHRRVATRQLVRRGDVARRAVDYRLCGEAVRTLIAANEPLRRLAAALPEDVREQAFPKAPPPGLNGYIDRQLDQDDPRFIQLDQHRMLCGSGLAWLFEYNNLDIRDVERDFDLAADDLECLLLIREPLGRITNAYKAAHHSPPGPVAGRILQPERPLADPPGGSTPEPPPPSRLDELPAWLEPIKKRRPRRVDPQREALKVLPFF